ELHRPRQPRLHAGERPQQRRLARAVGTQHARQLPTGERDVDVAQHDTRPVADGEVSSDEGVRAQVTTALEKRRLRSRTSTTTGAPMSDVTAFRGSTRSEPGRLATTDATRAIVAPSTAHAGTSTRWSDVPVTARARWATAMPRNAIGPQNAV